MQCDAIAKLNDYFQEKKNYLEFFTLINSTKDFHALLFKIALEMSTE